LLAGGNEIACSRIDIDIHHLDQALPQLTDTGAPMGSFLAYTDKNEQRQTIAFGKSVGLAIYLNDTDLPEVVYAKYDENYIISSIDKILEGFGYDQSFWHGQTETALSIHG